jgi:hypothetical protein
VHNQNNARHATDRVLIGDECRAESLSLSLAELFKPI